MKFYLTDRQGINRRKLGKEVFDYVSVDKYMEMVEAKRTDPLEEVSVMVKDGFIVVEED